MHVYYSCTCIHENDEILFTCLLLINYHRLKFKRNRKMSKKRTKKKMVCSHGACINVILSHN